MSVPIKKMKLRNMSLKPFNKSLGMDKRIFSKTYYMRCNELGNEEYLNFVRTFYGSWAYSFEITPDYKIVNENKLF